MPLAHFRSAQVSNAEVKQQFIPCVKCSKLTTMMQFYSSTPQTPWILWIDLQHCTMKEFYAQQRCKLGLRRPPRQKSTFFDIRVCHQNADSYKDLTPEQVYRLHENEKKRMHERQVLEVEQASFTPLVFTTTGGMGRECFRYHSRLAELISVEKCEDYAKTLTWIRGKVSFSI